MPGNDTDQGAQLSVETVQKWSTRIQSENEV